MTRTSLALRSGALSLVLACGALPSGAAEITSAAFDRGGINDTRPGFGSDTLRVVFETNDASASVLVSLSGEGEMRTLADEVVPAGTYTLGVTSESGAPGNALAEGTYVVTLAVTDTAGEADSTLSFVVDETAPVFRGLRITGPAGSFANGDYIPLIADMSERIEAFTLDVSEIDDVGDGSMPLVEAHDDTTYGLLYRISPDNTTEDADDVAISATAMDPFGNAATSSDVSLCLSSYPPLLESKRLVDAAGDTIPNDTAFTSGDDLRLRTRFQIRFANPVIPEFALQFRVDLSDLDTEFDLFGNPAVLDTSFADTVLTENALAPGYVYRITALHSYTLSEENLRQEGVYDAIVTALDAGCGETPTTPPFRIVLADLGPETPAFDEGLSTIITGSRATLTGQAPGAAFVRVETEAGMPRADAEVDTIAGTFTADVPLDPGRNRLVAIASDPYSHDSDPSEVLEIFRIESATLEVAPRIRPGDVFEVALLEPADRLDLDIFNMVGDRIHHDTTTSRAVIYAFVWDGRTQRGERARSGPYIAHVTIHQSGQKRTLNDAFVFTRK